MKIIPLDILLNSFIKTKEKSVKSKFISKIKCKNIFKNQMKKFEVLKQPKFVVLYL